MNASPIFTPVRSRASSSLRASTAFSAQGFLAQHVLAGLRGPDGPRDVKMIGQGIVDRFDFGIGQKLLVRSVRLRDAERPSGFFRFAPVAGSDGADFAPLARLHRRNHASHGDRCDAQHSPANFSRHLDGPSILRTRRSGLTRLGLAEAPIGRPFEPRSNFREPREQVLHQIFGVLAAGRQTKQRVAEAQAPRALRQESKRASSWPDGRSAPSLRPGFRPV